MNRTDHLRFDVCIAGGGPAGASLALRLAQLGRRVAIVEKAAFPRKHIGESLTGGVMPQLEVLGVRQEIENAGFLSVESATVHWAGQNRRHRTHVAGLQVDRGHFDSIMLNAAAACAQVRVYQPARIVSHIFENDYWLITLNTGVTLQAAYIADAAGRARILGGKKTPLGVTTLAIYAYWKNGIGCIDSDTLIEAGPAEWYWGAPLPDGKFNATVFVDHSPPPKVDHYFDLLKKSKLLWPKLNAGSICGTVKICDATAFVDQSPVNRRSINVGDAALSIDPLSSQGVQTAIGTAMHAAVVINTLIDRPEDAEFAMEFYRSRLQDSSAFHAAAASRFYKKHFDACGGDFWKKRATKASADFENERAAMGGDPKTLFRIAQEVQFVTIAAVDSAYVIRENGVKIHNRAIVYAGSGIRVAPLLQEIKGALPGAEVVRRWSTQMSPSNALQMFKWALAQGLFEACASTTVL